MADVELLPLPEHFAHQSERVQEHVHAYARACVEANLAPLQAENERLRADHAALRAEYYRVVHALQDEQARADRLAEALRGVMHWDNGKSEWDEARAALAQEDRND